MSFIRNDVAIAEKEVKDTQRRADMIDSIEAAGAEKTKKIKFFSRKFNPWAMQQIM